MAAKLKESTELAELEGQKASSLYERFKSDNSLKEILSEPYKYLDYDREKANRDSILGFSPTERLEVDGRFAGVIGSDMSVGDFSVHF